jgi:hypothetical protein
MITEMKNAFFISFSFLIKVHRLLSKFAFAFKIFGEGIPLHGVLLDIGLRALVVDELRGIAVI